MDGAGAHIKEADCECPHGGQRRTPEINRNGLNTPGMSADQVISARDRAFQLARTGEHSSWAEIAAALMREAYGEYVVQGIGADQRARAELDTIISRAQQLAGLRP